MNPEREAIDLIECLYAGLLEPERFTEFVANTSRALSAPFLFSPRVPGLGGPPTSFSAGFGGFLDEYNEHYYQFDPAWEQLAKANLSPGSTFCSECFAPRSFVESCILGPLAARYGIEWGPNWITTLEMRDGFPISTMIAGRFRGARERSAEERALHELLIPHAVTARRLWSRCEQGQQAERELETIFDHLPLGILIVDEALRVRLANRAARTLLERADGLCLHQGELVAGVGRAGAELRKRIATAAAAERGESPVIAAALSVPRPSGARPYEVVAVPLPVDGALRQIEVRGRAAIFVSDPDTLPIAPERILGLLYGLTRAESRLAWLLARDLPLKQAAAELRITEGTARQRTKDILRKTGTHRQVSLVRLLHSGPASLRLPPSSGGT